MGAAALLIAGTLLAACGGSGKPAATAPTTTSTSTSTSTSTPSTSTSTTETSTAITGRALSAQVVQASAGGVTATLHAPTHTPRAKQLWPFSFDVTDRGRPIRAAVSYEYLFGGAVVEKRSHYTFVGHFDDHSRWPEKSIGYPLTFRPVIVAGGHTFYLQYAIKVQRP